MSTPECFGCGESIPGGIQILGQYLCPACEADMVNAKVGKIEYQNWMDSWRQFWEKTGINIAEVGD